MPLTVVLNGQSRSFSKSLSAATLDVLVKELGLQGDRVAVEHNGTIVSSTNWHTTDVNEGDLLEIVHFVGGGLVGR